MRRAGKRAIWFFWGFILFVLLAALFVPPLDIDRRQRANQTSAVGRLRSLNDLQAKYRTLHPAVGFTCRLADLKRLDPDSQDAQLHLAEFYDGGKRSGYQFSIVGCESGAPNQRYQITAVPLLAGKTGFSAYCTDQSGVIFYDLTGSAEGCLSTRKPLE